MPQRQLKDCKKNDHVIYNNVEYLVYVDEEYLLANSEPRVTGHSLVNVKTGQTTRMTSDTVVNVIDDPIHHPPHYGGQENPYEAIKVIDAWQLGFCLGNTLKYIARAGKKNSDYLEDLRKARWYLDHEITRREYERAKKAD